ncbi:predicted protein [Thalassiosira pseudonana CCMP1335]|uniref:MINDY deubiquitinase domain-containing protein n=1 Tax=Thalassiosira pseudonana TaxID=35128 RepID=B8BSQ5_THAPS|nr:predicted protein [Thalassiosira pseudonana CCMP1335]EED95583.1 predicted protein [Thalassiosira pseudonana CCMP1335]
MLAERALASSCLSPQSAAAGESGWNDVGARSVSSERNAITTASSHHEYHLNEVLSLLPSLQHGMDVNPKFTCGPAGVEYTKNLAAFDLLGVDLVHGWLLDEQDVETTSVVGAKSYNELIELIILGNEGRELAGRLEAMVCEREERLLLDGSDWGGGDVTIEETREVGKVCCEDGGATDYIPLERGNVDDIQTNTEEANGSNIGGNSSQCRPATADDSLPVNPDWVDDATAATAAADNTQQTTALTNEEKETLQKEIVDLKQKITETSQHISQSQIVNNFLTTSCHQLTYHGLEKLHNHVGEDALCVFFRNNHFATLTKHNGVLYLLVTDLGYANTPEIVWEKLDAIDGDTEYVNEMFSKPAPRDELKPASGPTIAPELLLAQRSQAESDYQLAIAMSEGLATSQRMDDDEGRLMEAAKEMSLKAYHGEETTAATSSGVQSNDTAATQVDADREMALAWQREQQQIDHESEQLARQLQELEYARQQRPTAARPARRAPTPKANNASSSCIIS